MVHASRPHDATPGVRLPAPRLCAALLGGLLAFSWTTPVSAQFQVLCFPGTASPTGVLPCTACAPGTFAAGRGSKQCTPCAPGTYADEPGSTECVRDEVDWPVAPSFPPSPLEQCDDEDDLEKCIQGGIRDGGIVNVIEEQLPAQDLRIDGKSFTLRPKAGVTPVFLGETFFRVFGGDNDVRVEFIGLGMSNGSIRAIQALEGDFEVSIRDNEISCSSACPAVNGFKASDTQAPIALEVTGNRILVSNQPDANAAFIGINQGFGSHLVMRDNVIRQTDSTFAVVAFEIADGTLDVDVMNNRLSGSGFGTGIRLVATGGEVVARIANNAVSGQLDDVGHVGAISAFVGGGIHDFTIVNNSLAFNESGLVVGIGPAPDAHLSADVANNLVAFNENGMDLHPEVANAFNLVFGNDSDSFTPGPGTLAADPLLSVTDLSLEPGSPARDAGSNAFVPADLTVDLAGGPRIAGSRVDIGAYELTAVPEPSGAAAAAAAAVALHARRRAARAPWPGRA